MNTDTSNLALVGFEENGLSTLAYVDSMSVKGESPVGLYWHHSLSEEDRKFPILTGLPSHIRSLFKFCSPESWYYWAWLREVEPSKQLAGQVTWIADDACLVHRARDIFRCATSIPETTEPDVAPVFQMLSDETNRFVLEHHLEASVEWLKVVARNCFPGASFELDLDYCDDDDGQTLALAVYGQFEVRDFRERRHELTDAMQKAGHTALYMILGIFQRSVQGSGWEALSSYRRISAE